MVPLFLVALNMLGIVSAVRLAKAWRIAVFLTFLFAAVASPSPDAGSMLALAFPMVGLYMLAVGIACVERPTPGPPRGWPRRSGDLSDDEASPLGRRTSGFDPDARRDDARVDAATGPCRT